jgi:hypothetical protein
MSKHTKAILTACIVGLLFLMSGCGRTREAAAPAADLVVLRATYGVGHNTVDVTAAIQSLVRNGAVHLRPKWDIGPVDPAYGVIKRVTIAYQYRGQIQVATFEQTEELDLPAGDSPHRPASRI